MDSGSFLRASVAVILACAATPFGRSGWPVPICADNPRPTIEVKQCRLHLIDEVRLASERSGILVDIAHPGTMIQAGGVVATIRDSVVQASYAVAEKEAANDVEVRFALKSSELAQLKYQRAMEADRSLAGTVTDFELRELRLAAEKSLLQMEQAEHQKKIAELRRLEHYETLQALQIRTPFDAFVRIVHKKPGEFVREGETVVEVVKAGRFRIDAYIDAMYLPHLSVGDQARISVTSTVDGQRDLESQQTYVGQITFVDIKVEPVSSKFLVWVEVQHADARLHDGQSVSLTINP